jgi:hypothetical protein
MPSDVPVLGTKHAATRHEAQPGWCLLVTRHEDTAAMMDADRCAKGERSELSAARLARDGQLVDLVAGTDRSKPLNRVVVPGGLREGP